jgi:hypothetical protein
VCLPRSWVGSSRNLSSRLETGCDVAFSASIREGERKLWTCRPGGSQVGHGQTERTDRKRERHEERLHSSHHDRFATARAFPAVPLCDAFLSAFWPGPGATATSVTGMRRVAVDVLWSSTLLPRAKPSLFQPTSHAVESSVPYHLASTTTPSIAALSTANQSA